MEYEAVIGLEVHAQLLTKSKMFCGCSTDYRNSPPNTHVCQVCLGMPGVLPVMNRLAVEFTIMTALALHCEIPEFSKFDRKNYPYPDLMKGYQISQFDEPLSHDGWLEIEGAAGKRQVGITRVHLEEDTARLLHRGSNGDKYTLVDINRAGMPLMEIVGEPDLRSPAEAGDYLTKVRLMVQYLGVNSGKMEEGSLRCDANISLRPKGADYLNPKVEVKNMNSIQSVVRALEFEYVRQAKLHDAGEEVAQETRGWVDDRNVTVSQRSKEQAHDYRYFPEPDLPPLLISRDWLAKIRDRLPELPEALRIRLMADYGLNEYDSAIIVGSKAMAAFFEATVAGSNLKPEDVPKRAKAVANWLQGEYLRLQRDRGLHDDEMALRPQQLIDLLVLLDAGTINGPTAKSVFAEILGTEKSPKEIVEEKGLAQIGEDSELDSVAQEVIEANAPAVADYLAGKEQALKFLVGQMMRATKGRAKPDVAQKLLKGALERISESVS